HGRGQPAGARAAGADASVRRYVHEALGRTVTRAAYALGQTGDSTAVDSLLVRVQLEPTRACAATCTKPWAAP
ncbi:hypothetical protein, partial [Hymenobacter glacialis]|uniref:hypothetical protein n=1 Tax=Hymenobacter glacialis TaxID=1908236 RepID=UPI0013011007